MSRVTIIGEMPGGAALCQWFGQVPTFHDAELRALTLAPGQACELVLHAFRITNDVDPHGRFVIDRHADVTITCEDVFDVVLQDFAFALPAILLHLVIERDDETLRVAWQSAYGLDGDLKVKGVRITHRPSGPAQSDRKGGQAR